MQDPQTQMVNFAKFLFFRYAAGSTPSDQQIINAWTDFKRQPDQEKSEGLTQLQSLIMTQTSADGWYIFIVMMRAQASEQSILRALRPYRSSLSRMTLHKWAERYRELHK